MENKFGIIGKILSYLLMAAGVGVTIWILSADAEMMKDFNLAEMTQQQIMNATIAVAAIALGLTALLTIGFPIVGMLLNPKRLVGFLIIIGALGLVYLLSYSMADSTVLWYMVDDYETSEAGSKWVGSLLYVTYIIGGLAVVSVLGSSIMNLFKR